MTEDNPTPEERIENAQMAASETQPSWKHRCYAIMGALGLDYGDPDWEMPDDRKRSQERLVQDVAHKLTGLYGSTCCHRTGGKSDDPDCECRKVATEIVALYAPSSPVERRDDTCPRTGLPHAYWPQGNCQYCGALSPALAAKEQLP